MIFAINSTLKQKNGENGKSKNKTGESGKRLIIKVPSGTEIYNEDRTVLLADIIKKNDQIIIARGGRGGLGNSRFKSSTNQSTTAIYRRRKTRRKMDMAIIKTIC